jgi:hypothetical protein
MLRNFALILTGLALLILQSGCKHIDKLTVFNIDYNTQTVISSAVRINVPFNLITPDITTNSNSEFAINETRKDLIEEIQLTRVKLLVTVPADGDLSFLKSIKIYIKGEGLEEKLIAWNENIDTSGKTILLTTTPDDLQEYVKLDSISLRVNTVTNKILLTDYTIDISAGFRVDARILGV